MLFNTSEIVQDGHNQGQKMLEMWVWIWVLPFWKAVLEGLEGCLKIFLPESPQFSLLGDRSLVPPGLTKAEFGLAVSGFIVAARLILCNWKNPRSPEHTDWLKLMTEIAAFQKMIARINDVQWKNSQIWQKFMDYIKGTSFYRVQDTSGW